MTGEKKLVKSTSKGAGDNGESETGVLRTRDTGAQDFWHDATSSRRRTGNRDYARHALNLFHELPQTTRCVIPADLIRFYCRTASVAALTLNRMRDPAVLAVEP